jgi:hypothetical protein
VSEGAGLREVQFIYRGQFSEGLEDRIGEVLSEYGLIRTASAIHPTSGFRQVGFMSPSLAGGLGLLVEPEE